MAGLNSTNFSGHRVEYNGVAIGGGDSEYSFMPHESDMSGVHVYDDAGRTVIYIAYTLRVATYTFLKSGGSSSTGDRDTSAEKLQRLLSEENKPLTIGGMGFGKLSINKDVIWGPKPRIISFRPVGGALCHEIIWQVDFHLKPCVLSASQIAAGITAGQYLAFNWGSQFSLDHEGLLTHTVSGYYEIPRNLNSHKIEDKISILISDQRREDFHVPVPVGFRRVGQTYVNNAAKTRTDFSVVDVQFTADAFPVGISNAIGEYSFATNSENFHSSTATLTMALTVQPGFAMSTGGFFFLRAALKKADELRQQAIVPESSRVPVVLPTSFTVKESLWTRTTVFSMSFEVTSDLSELLAFTQVWRPLGDQTGQISDFQKWQAGRDAHRLDSPRGFSRLAELEHEDKVINACSLLNKGRKIGELRPVGSTVREFPTQRFGCPENIDVLNSWLSTSWKVVLKNEQHDSVYKKAVDGFIETAADLISGFSDVLLNGLGNDLTETINPYIRDGTSDIVHERHGDPVTKIRIYFMGFRIKYKWQFPVVSEYGGVELEPLGSAFIEVEQTACVLGCSVEFGRGYQDFKTKDGKRITKFEAFSTPNTQCKAVDPNDEPQKDPTDMPQ